MLTLGVKLGFFKESENVRSFATSTRSENLIEMSTNEIGP